VVTDYAALEQRQVGRDVMHTHRAPSWEAVVECGNCDAGLSEQELASFEP
jgi:hypothetical protein